MNRRENAVSVRVSRTLTLFRIHRAQHILKCAVALCNLLKKTNAFGWGEGDTEVAAAVLARNQTPRTRQGNRVVPRRHESLTITICPI